MHTLVYLIADMQSHKQLVTREVENRVLHNKTLRRTRVESPGPEPKAAAHIMSPSFRSPFLNLSLRPSHHVPIDEPLFQTLSTTIGASFRVLRPLSSRYDRAQEPRSSRLIALQDPFLRAAPLALEKDPAHKQPHYSIH